MGNWNITIQGTGCHHNGKPEIDADLAAARLVEELLAQGQDVSLATFTSGGTQDLLQTVQREDRVRCIVNGVQTELPRIATYYNVMAQAASTTEQIGLSPTITFHVPGKNSSGMLTPGQSMVVEEGTVFNVCNTSQA